MVLHPILAAGGRLTAAIQALKESGYIVPDFGDAGGRLFGTK
jgi:uracil phosphoribosyltransferase